MPTHIPTSTRNLFTMRTRLPTSKRNDATWSLTEGALIQNDADIELLHASLTRLPVTDRAHSIKKMATIRWHEEDIEIAHIYLIDRERFVLTWYGMENWPLHLGSFSIVAHVRPFDRRYTRVAWYHLLKELRKLGMKIHRVEWRGDESAEEGAQVGRLAKDQRKRIAKAVAAEMKPLVDDVIEVWKLLPGPELDAVNAKIRRIVAEARGHHHDADQNDEIIVIDSYDEEMPIHEGAAHKETNNTAADTVMQDGDVLTRQPATVQDQMEETSDSDVEEGASWDFAALADIPENPEEQGSAWDFSGIE